MKMKMKRIHLQRRDQDLRQGRALLAAVQGHQVRQDLDQIGGQERVVILGQGQGNFSCGMGFRSSPKTILD